MAARLLIVAAVLAIRLPFLWHPIQGDDAFYIAAAEHAQVDPLHPHAFVHVAQGMEIDMRGYPHPPGNTWILAALLAATGDVVEPVYHGFYVLFSIVAALAAWSLAQRFCTKPRAAMALFLATPAFVINGTSLESDVPFLAFWLASVALFVRAVDEASTAKLLAAAAAMMIAVQIAYQAVILMPVLAWYLWRERRGWASAWVALLSPAAMFGGWQLFERMHSGAMPAEVLTGHFETHKLQSLANKLRNAASLTVHLGWMVSPLLAPRAWLIAPVALGAAWFDASPLFWLPFAIGCATLVAAFQRAPEFPNAWLLLFFAAALVIFFAGSARYLLPVALPVAVLTANRFASQPRLLASAAVLHLALGLTLARANQQHWELYRHTVAELGDRLATGRAWVNAEWGLRFYAESAGAAPVKAGQTFRPGDFIVSSALGGAVRLPDGPRYVRVTAEERTPRLRLIGQDSRSAYSTATHGRGLRAFDYATSPIDTISFIQVRDVAPTLSYITMGDAAADAHIVSGVYRREGDSPWRWTARRAEVAVKTPDRPAYLEASFRLLDPMRGRRVSLLLNGAEVASAQYDAADQFTLRSAEPSKPEGKAASLSLAVSETFRAPGDQRDLGLILTGIGFR